MRNYDDDYLIHALFYGSEKFNFDLNKEIIKLTACFLKDTKRFDKSLFWTNRHHWLRWCKIRFHF